MSVKDVVDMVQKHGCAVGDISCTITPIKETVVVEVVVNGKHYSAPLPPDTAIDIGLHMIRTAFDIKQEKVSREKIKKLWDALEKSGARTVVIA